MSRKSKAGIKLRKVYNKKYDRTYWYEVVGYKKSKSGKRSPILKSTKVVRHKKPLTREQVQEWLSNNSVSIEESRLILNEQKAEPSKITETWLEDRIDSYEKSKVERMVRNLGYSMDEFREFTGLSEEDLAEGTLKRVGTDVSFTPYGASQATLYFTWDYDRGFM